MVAIGGRCKVAQVVQIDTASTSSRRRASPSNFDYLQAKENADDGTGDNEQTQWQPDGEPLATAFLLRKMIHILL